MTVRYARSRAVRIGRTWLYIPSGTPQDLPQVKAAARALRAAGYLVATADEQPQPDDAARTEAQVAASDGIVVLPGYRHKAAVADQLRTARRHRIPAAGLNAWLRTSPAGLPASAGGMFAEHQDLAEDG